MISHICMLNVALFWSVCESPLGMENSLIANNYITATSSLENFNPWQARFNGPSAWCPKTFLEQNLQIHLQRPHRITALGIQGYRNGSVPNYIKLFHVSFLTEMNEWMYYINGKGDTKVL